METDAPAATAIERCVQRGKALLAAAVAAADERRATAFDPLRGLYVTEREVKIILAEPAPAAPRDPPWILPELAPVTDDPRLHDAIAVAVAAEHVPRLDRVFGYVHDDLTRRTFTTGLAIELLGLRAADLAPDAALVRLSVLDVPRGEIPLAEPIRIDRGFVAWLAGDRRLDRRIRTHATWCGAKGPPEAPLHDSPLLLWGASADEISAAAEELVARSGLPSLLLDALAPVEHVAIAARDALLRAAALVVQTNEPRQAHDVAQLLSELGMKAVVEAPAGALRYAGAARRVAQRPAVSSASPSAYPLPFGRRWVPRRTLADLVLPAVQLRAIRSVADRLAQRNVVLAEWGVDRGSSVGGVRALFAGPPGTGKTMAAEALAHELGRDLYVVDVSTVVSKYIGETEKALATIFAEAARAGVCLFFDEADAIFGKRTETKDAHDRYANIETAYLLQALDLYPDLVILATNLAGNVDDALVRRIDVKVEFVMPDARSRRTLWERSLARAPRHDVDVTLLADRLPLSGGAIQSAALAAAFRAAADGRAIGTLDLMRAARDELAKLGRVAGRIELGEYFDALRLEELR